MVLSEILCLFLLYSSYFLCFTNSFVNFLLIYHVICVVLNKKTY